MAFSNPVTGGQGGLIRPAIKSPNFLTGVSGWTVNRDGSVEFNNGVFRGTLTASTFMGTDFIISAAGQFFYSGTPALGNLLYSVCVADGTDSFGNHVLAGFTAYDNPSNAGPVSFVQMTGGSVIYGSVTAGVFQTVATGAATVQGSTSVLGLVAPVDPLNPVTTADKAVLTLLSGATGQATGSATGPFAQLLDSAHSSASDLRLSGSVIKTDFNGAPLGKQTPGYNASWAGGSTASALYGALEYWIENDNLYLAGAFHATGAAAVALFTLPAAYRPAKSWQGIIWKSTAGTDTLDVPARLQVNASGVVNVAASAAAAANVNYYADCVFPLGTLT